MCGTVEVSAKGAMLRQHRALFAQRIWPGIWSTRVRCARTGSERDTQGPLPVAESLGARMLILPMFDTMTESDVRYVTSNLLCVADELENQEVTQLLIARSFPKVPSSLGLFIDVTLMRGWFSQ